MAEANKTLPLIAVAAVALILIVLFIFFSKPAAPGSDRDAYGCIPSAGYQWCAVLSKCIRPWEENCTVALPPGGAPNMMKEEVCAPAGGHVSVAASAANPCPQGEFPLAEVESAQGTTRYCCMKVPASQPPAPPSANETGIPAPPPIEAPPAIPGPVPG